MARSIRITLVSDHVETVQVAENVSLEALLGDPEDEFLILPTQNQGEYVVPKRNIVAIVKEGKNGERPKRRTS
jgi:hypothetical protein